MMGRALLCLLLWGSPRLLLAQAPGRLDLHQDAERPKDVLDDVYQCFRDALHTATHGQNTVNFGPGTEAYFFEQLGAAMQSLGNAPKLAWCEPWFVEPYVKAHEVLHGPEGHAPKHAAHLPLSTGVHLAKEARLIHLASRMGGVSHVSAHADMVRQALSTPAVSRQLRRLGVHTCARGLLMQGAQVPDLYLFDSPLWHAQSQDSEQDSLAPKPQEVERSRQHFVQLVVRAVHEGQQAAVRQDLVRAMLLLGAAAHAVQDLHYHRGMTQAEKAGLTYVAHSNPDLPAEPQDQRLHQAATQATGVLLAAALAPLQINLGALHADDVEEDHEILLPLIADIWPEAEPVTYDAMRAYYGAGCRYRRLPGMQGAQALSHANLGRWSAEATFNAILAAL